MRRSTTPTTAILISAVMLAALSGCSLTLNVPPATSSSSAATTTPTEVETTTPTAEPVALSIPGCNDLITLDQVRSALGAPNAVLHEEGPANGYSPWYYAPKPSVVSAISGLTEGYRCWWGPENSDYGFTVMVGEIDAATRSSIEAELIANGFSATTVGARAVYGIEDNDNDTAETHQFIGDVWILSNGPDLDITGVGADYAYEALRTANPSLGL